MKDKTMRRDHVSWSVLLIAALSICSCSKDSTTSPVQTENPVSSGTWAQVATVQGGSTTEAIAGLAISPDKKLIAFGSFADNVIRLLDAGTRQVTRTLTGHTNRVTALAFSPDSRTLASTGTVNLQPADGSVRLWDVSSGLQLATTSTTGINQLAFSPNGASLAGASGGNPVQIQVWNPATLSVQRTITGVFRFVAFSPDGTRIAAGARDEKVYIMNFLTGSQIATYTGHTGWITNAAFSSDGTMLASTGDDKKILVWNAQTGASTLTITGHTTYPEFVCFSPDGATLVSLGTGMTITRSGSSISMTLSDSDRFPRMWNPKTAEEFTRIDVGGDIVSEIAISADWRLMVTGSKTGLLRIFQK
jgi:WD40 repeat protein